MTGRLQRLFCGCEFICRCACVHACGSPQYSHLMKQMTVNMSTFIKCVHSLTLKLPVSLDKISNILHFRP